jgi:hypothetical protein
LFVGAGTALKEFLKAFHAENGATHYILDASDGDTDERWSIAGDHTIQ